MRTETRLVVEPRVIPSATNLGNPMSATHDSSEPTLVPGTDETQDRESPDTETNDPDMTATVPETPPVVQPVPHSPLAQHRIYGQRELFRNLSAITKSKGLANLVGENLKTTSKDDSHLHRVSDDQGVELTHDVSWNDLSSSRNLIASTIR